MTKVKKLYNNIYAYFTKPNKSILQEWLEALIVVGFAFFFIKTYIGGLYHVPTGSAEPNLLVGDRVVGNKIVYQFLRRPKRGELVMFDDPKFQYDINNKLNYLWQKYIGIISIPILGLEEGPVNVVKRVVGIPGDTVEGRVENDETVIYLNGKQLEEPYLNILPLIALNKKVGFLNFDSFGPIRIPEFLRGRVRQVTYTYDPKVDFEHQPYYNMSKDEAVINPYTLEPLLLLAKSPTRLPYGRVVDNFGPFVIPEGKYWVMGDSRKNSEDSRFWGFLDESLVQGKASFILYSVDSEEPVWFFEWFKRPFSFWTKCVRWTRIFKGL
ncbi:signal peptidase I [Candidatus Babeliales bacterium]|nr:signal peptidase I [Candidatus Babeliales bacterium]